MKPTARPQSRVAWLLAAVMLTLVSGSAAPECGTCHPAETNLHEHSRMAHAMLPAAGSAFGQNLPAQPLRASSGGYGVSYRLSPFGSIR